MVIFEIDKDCLGMRRAVLGLIASLGLFNRLSVTTTNLINLQIENRKRRPINNDYSGNVLFLVCLVFNDIL